MITNAAYDSVGNIRTTYNGQELTVPDDHRNGHRILIAEWVRLGNTIAPYVAPATTAPSVVSARQFKLQLLAADLLTQVDAWVASQDMAIRIAYENSGTFLRTEPMMQQGFAALGFTEAQIDAFFLAASAL